MGVSYWAKCFFFWDDPYEIYVYLDINNPTNVIKIDHPKNNGNVLLLFSNNCHYDALVPYNDEEEEEKDQLECDQEYKSTNFSMKEVSLKASKKYEERLILSVK